MPSESAGDGDVYAVEKDSANEGVGENEMEFGPPCRRRTELVEGYSSCSCKGGRCGTEGKECSADMAELQQHSVTEVVKGLNFKSTAGLGSGGSWHQCRWVECRL